MLICGLDVETTGFDPKTDKITEIGAILWETDSDKPVEILSKICKHADMPKISSEITELTGIDNQMVEDHGICIVEVFSQLMEMADKAEFMVAHNAKFDRGFTEELALELGGSTITLPWICTREDVPYPKFCKSRSLMYLSAFHSFVNPFPHRAVFDVAEMLNVLSFYPIDEVIKISKSATLTIVANVPYAERQLAKDKGFHWNKEKKRWELGVKEIFYKAGQYDFPVSVLSDEIPF